MEHKKFIEKRVEQISCIECDMCGYKEYNASGLYGDWWRLSGLDKIPNPLYSDETEIEYCDNCDYWYDLCVNCIKKILSQFPIKNKGEQ